MDVVTTDERRPSTTEQGPAETPAPREGAMLRIRAAFQLALPALVAYAATRVVGGVTLYIWARATNRSPESLLTRFDGTYYLSIAQHGYDGYEKLQSNMAFFPLYPGVLALLEPLSPFDHRKTALVVAWAAALAAAWGLFAVGNLLHGRRVGILVAVLWECFRTASSSRCRTARACSRPSRPGRSTRCCAIAGSSRACSACSPASPVRPGRH